MEILNTSIIRKNLPEWAIPLMQPKRYKGAKGGRGSGKSHHFAEMVIGAILKVPTLRIVCIREIQKSIAYSSKQLLEDKIIRDYSEVFDIMKSEIRHKAGGVIIFQGMQDHTADSIKSLEGFNIAWVEEAQSISQRSLELLLPTIRAEGSEIWFSWNPELDTDPVERFFAISSDDKVCVHVNYTDNPFLPSTLKLEAERHKIEQPESFHHVWLGDYIKQGLVFRADMFKVETEIPIDLHYYIAVDVALTVDEKNDRSAICVVGVSEQNNIYVLEQIHGRFSSIELKETIIDLLTEYPEAQIGIEKSSVSVHFIEDFRNLMVLRRVATAFEELTPSGRNKQKRIENYILSAIQQHSLFFANKPDEVFMQEALSFPTGTHDDTLDALAYAIEFAKRRPREGKSMSISEYQIPIEGWL